MVVGEVGGTGEGQVHVELVTGGQRLHRYEDYLAALAACGESVEPYAAYLRSPTACLCTAVSLWASNAGRLPHAG
ncbi:hypothetical protein [Streptomyces kaniharaensis]|uniref:hypothetical protein n=1 Tax=Streptomyces kaniharaensis TaxID=212423 RepID=UPI001E339092|nr:hypothetical protein [Streptomyces kaniharaensis]